ncbi:MAG: porphobilinogen synthase [Bdellovibrionota bacterium]|nr:porphobilinogen synthase [Deltaproteobacteria bacterium]
MAYFPKHRGRRLRQTESFRRLVRETSLSVDNLIAPLFVKEGIDRPRPIISMPGQFQDSTQSVVEAAKKISDMGIPAIMLFGIPAKKDRTGTENFRGDGFISETIMMIKKACPDLILISDMCFCEYTEHGHCGVLNKDSAYQSSHLDPHYVCNDGTLELLQKASVMHVQAGADMIAPSGMIDGMIQAIRNALDESAFGHVPIMSYAVKYASAFYGPFREAAEGAPQFGDRKQYQMDICNVKEGLLEAKQDIAEGADILMVKPAMAYLDVISKLAQTVDIPIAAYQVSGEFAMLHAAHEKGWLDLSKAAVESLVSIKRAGANMIVTYFARDFAAGKL